MGLGDWLMASADVKRANEKWGVRVVLGDGRNDYWSEVFDNNPRVTRAKDLRQGEKYAWVANFPSRRPYIVENDGKRFTFKDDFKAEPGELFLTDAEKNQPKDLIIVEPNIKEKFLLGKNKDWGWDNWRALVTKLDLPWTQLGDDEARSLGVNRHRTRKFRSALGVLSQAKLLVTTDGALHHAAAALGIPAVVLWGGVASPNTLGYDMHTNLWHGDEPCGSHSIKCEHCKQAMAKISVEEVIQAVEAVLKT